MENEEKQERERGESPDEQASERFACDSEDMLVVDFLCDACMYRLEGDAVRCQQFPNGKPEEILDKEYYCPKFSVYDLDSLLNGG